MTEISHINDANDSGSGSASGNGGESEREREPVHMGGGRVGEAETIDPSENRTASASASGITRGVNVDTKINTKKNHSNQVKRKQSNPYDGENNERPPSSASNQSLTGGSGGDSDSMGGDRDLDLLTNIIQQRTDEQYMDNLSVLRNRVTGNTSVNNGNSHNNNSNGPGQPLHNNDDFPSASEFFDTNEGGYSHYCSVLEASVNEDDLRGKEKAGMVSTKFQFDLKQASMRLHLLHPDERTSTSSSEAFISIEVEGLSVTSRKSNLHQNVHLEIAGFVCEHSRSLTNGDCRHVSSILRFEAESHHADDSDNNNIISPSPMLSLSIDSRECIDGISHSDIQVAVKPIFFTYHQMILSDVQRCLSEISQKKLEGTTHPEEETSLPSTTSINCQVICEKINVLVPIEVVGEANKRQLSSVSADLVDRSGYIISLHEPLLSPAISLEISDFVFAFVQGTLQGREEKETEDMNMTASFQRSALSFIVPVKQFDTTNAAIGRKFDFIAFESETRIDPDAIVKVEYSKTFLSHKSDTFKKERAKSNFPLVTPLASVKASQNCEKKEPDESMTSPENNVLGKNRLRGSDPQIAMLKDLLECDQVLSVHIPSLAVDLTVLEKDAILRLISCIPKTPDGNGDGDGHSQKTSVLPINISFRCDQLSITIHQNNDADETIEKELFSYTLIGDGLRSHVLFCQNTLKHARLVCHDLTLFEVQDQYPSVAYDNTTKQTVKEICDFIRKRRGERRGVATPIFFRSKLSQCLSTATPAIILDLLVQSDEYHIERAVHISLYDMTYRYDCEGDWLGRVMDLLKSNDSPEERESVHTNLSNDEEEMAIVNNIFATISDCNIDYTSPASFVTPSRTILRLGEVRFTSNIIIPSGPAQVFKITVADAAVHISNKRVGHEVENAKLSCASIFQNTILIEGGSKSFPHSLDDALLRMAFVRIASLDFFESTITKVDGTDSQNTADSTALCSVGRVSIYACRDSFVCFTETINELLLQLTMPTYEELEELRRDFFNSKQNPSSQEKQKREELSFGEETSYLIQHPTPLADVLENGLFTSIIAEEENQLHDEEMREDTRNLIDDFFSADRKPSADEVVEVRSEQDANDDDWTSVHHSWANDQSIPDDQEQAARWYPPYDDKVSDSTSSLLLPKETKVIVDGESTRQPRIISHHVPIDPVTHPSAEGDMGASRFIGSNKPLKVTFRLLVQDMCLDCRFFDGYDWPRDQSRREENANQGLMNDLLSDNVGETNIFSDSQDKMISDTAPPRHTRRYFQFSYAGLKLRLDSFAKSQDHSLCSCMNLSLSDMYLIETISSRGAVPVKLLGEWVNDDHTRDSNDGLMAMKLFSMLPDEMFSSDGKLMGNEGRATLEFLPIRFLIHQVALRFIRDFFRHEDGNSRDPTDHSVTPPEMFFPVFRVKPFNIKVDYKPKTVDTSALKDGSLIELLNVLPLEDMILRLSEVEMRNLTGWGSIISELACNWLADVSSTQMHKFLTRTTPLHPFATVGDGMKQFLMIPLEEYKQKGDVKRGFRKGTRKLASVLAYETLSVGARLTGFAAKALGKRKSKTGTSLNGHMATPTQIIPTLPRSMDEVSGHALESLARGLKEANAKIVIIPYREYQKTGTRGAVKCVVKGLPVAVCAPLSGAAEAVSYSLYGVRNQLRPDLLEEEEASKRLHNCDIQF